MSASGRRLRSTSKTGSEKSVAPVEPITEKKVQFLEREVKHLKDLHIVFSKTILNPKTIWYGLGARRVTLQNLREEEHWNDVYCRLETVLYKKDLTHPTHISWYAQSTPHSAVVGAFVVEPSPIKGFVGFDNIRLLMSSPTSGVDVVLSEYVQTMRMMMAQVVCRSFPAYAQNDFTPQNMLSVADQHLTAEIRADVVAGEDAVQGAKRIYDALVGPPPRP